MMWHPSRDQKEGSLLNEVTNQWPFTSRPMSVKDGEFGFALVDAFNDGNLRNFQLKEISPEYSLEGLMLKLKLLWRYFGHLMRRTDSLEKTLLLGKIEGKRRRGQQRMSWLDGIIDSWTWIWASSGSWWWIGKPGMLQSMGSQRVGHNWDWADSWCFQSLGCGEGGTTLIDQQGSGPELNFTF